MRSEDVENITTWAVDMADKYNRGIMEIVARFKELEHAGVSIEQAKMEIENTYSN